MSFIPMRKASTTMKRSPFSISAAGRCVLVPSDDYTCLCTVCYEEKRGPRSKPVHNQPTELLGADSFIFPQLFNIVSFAALGSTMRSFTRLTSIPKSVQVSELGLSQNVQTIPQSVWVSGIFPKLTSIPQSVRVLQAILQQTLLAFPSLYGF